jgi:hypothetical protein
VRNSGAKLRGKMSDTAGGGLEGVGGGGVFGSELSGDELGKLRRFRPAFLRCELVD